MLFCRKESIISVWFQDSLSQCRGRCRQELEELRKHQTEKVQLLLQQNEEKEQALKAENERALALLIQDNEAQEALMVAKHDEEERAARKASELEAERNASATSRPHIPECPVGNISEFEILRTLPDGRLLFNYISQPCITDRSPVPGLLGGDDYTNSDLPV